MKKKLFGLLRTDRRGLALISVLGVVTLATILIMALFSISDAEYRAAKVYAEGNSARHLADSAINIVQAQIQTAATGGSNQVKPAIWVSQPGAVRTYNAAGQFIEGRTLFSASNMVTTNAGIAGEREFTFGAAGSPRVDGKWSSKPDQWVDMNQPVVRSRSGDASDIEVTFPILDPRAKQRDSFGAIHGFDYYETIPSSAGSGGKVDGVVENDSEADAMRCPMPVEWLYVLKDGTVGTVTVTEGTDATARWRSAGGTAPSEENPIIGRIAFWTDDESSKININTAGEPSPWLPPTAYHNRDMLFANNQPVVAESYRFPGHPATVSLSTVLAPKFVWDTYPTFPADSINFKMDLYSLLPRLEGGGTRDGTLPFDSDDFNATAAGAVDWEELQSERLFTSVDEFLFSNSFQGGGRVPNTLSYSGTNIMAPERLNRSKFFLTANSSSPETNMFSLPRVAIWPLPDKTLGPTYRHGNDDSMQASATLGSNLTNYYAFSRIDSRSALKDIGADSPANSGVARNLQLMGYLDKMINATMPGGSSFIRKYQASGGYNDARQVLVQIFDYIRCTNLFDNYLNEQTIGTFGLDYRDGGKLDQVTTYRETPKFGRFFTYTEPRFEVTRRAGNVYGLPTNRQAEFKNENVMTGAYPGHGQVRPIEWVPPGDRVTYKGFGRFPTISEVALHFICTADGLNSQYSYTITTSSGQTIRSGGKVAQKIDITEANVRAAVTYRQGADGALSWDRWYSNLPPFPNNALFQQWGCNFALLDHGITGDPARHPGWNSSNWNCTLDYNPTTRTGVPLKENEKRVQVALLLETFIPAAGWTKYVPDWTIVLRGEDVNGILVTDVAGNKRSIFETTGDQVIQSTFAYIGGQVHGMNEGDNVYPLGGAYGTGALLNGRKVKAVGRMPRDPGYNDQSTTDVHSAMQNFPLVSNFITVKRDEDIKFEATRPLKIDIYASHDWKGQFDKRGSTPVQTLEIEFPGGQQTTPVPDLVVESTEYVDYIDENGNQVVQQAIPAVRWWAFNYGGAVNRYIGTGSDGPNWSGVRENVEGAANQSGTIAAERTWGRFHGESHATILSKAGVGGTVNIGNGRTVSRSGRIVTSGLIYGFSSSTNFSGIRSWPGVDNRAAANNANTGGLSPSGAQIPGKAKLAMGTVAWAGTDSIRSMIPASGDYRLIAAARTVPKEAWIPHPVWTKRPESLFAHNLTSYSSNSQVGADFGDDNDPTVPDAKYRLVPNAWYRIDQVPDIPLAKYASESASKYRDWDNGSGLLRDGAYINKPDDGNLSVMQLWHGGAKDPGIYRIRNAYFTQSWLQVPSRKGFFSPNRLATSPGIFGSLPTGVHGSLSDGREARESKAGVPWRTLLFRADIGEMDGEGRPNGKSHPGASSALGGIAPADHYFMDLFWMPVIDPRPMSLGFATEGKINMNYQILPFRHIRRATALHGALRGELITAYSQFDKDPRRRGTPSAANTLIYKALKDGSKFPNEAWSESNPDNMNWHRRINIDETLKQFEERFSFQAESNELGGLFRTASQICEMHLIPEGAPRNEEPNLTNLTATLRKSSMQAFWRSNAITGDNVRERPYANIYQKLTTRSNSFRVYFRAQTIQKAKSLQPEEVNTRKDTVTAEYRGSALIQRYLDQTQLVTYPDYAALPNPLSQPSLETFYRYRVLEMKQFAP